MHQLYGDGLHDDHPAIQALFDSGIAQVELPVPAAHYCISRTLRIHGGQTLRLPRTAVIRLLPGSDCLMLANAEADASDIAVEGDIDSLSFDNLSRREDPSARETFGIGAHAHIENLALSHILQRGAPGMAPVLLRNAGRIDRLSLYDIDAGDATVLENAGDIGFVLTEHS